jgi:hypothetical protein
MTAFVLIPTASVGWWWEDAIPFVEKVIAKSHGYLKAVDVLDRLKEGRYRLWMAWRADPVGVVITEFCDYPQKRTCIVRVLGAHFMPSEWRAFLARIEAWAKQNGCQAMEVFGRKGWDRKLDDYTLQQVVLRKEL